MHRQEHRRPLLPTLTQTIVIGPADHRRAIECLSVMPARLIAPLQATEPATLTLSLMHFYSHTPLQTESLCLLTHDVIKQMLCRLFAIACMCAHKHTDSRSLTISLTLLNRAQTAFSVHITCMLYMEYLIHSIQVTIYTSARVLCSCVCHLFLSLLPHITQHDDTVTNPPLVLCRRVQLTTSQRRLEDTGESRPLRKQRF